MRIKIKNKIFEVKPSSYGFFQIIDILKNDCKGFYNENKIWEVPATIRNFQTLIPIINNKEFNNYFKELVNKKKQNKVKTNFNFLYDFQKDAVNRIANAKYSGFILSFEQGLGKTLTGLCSAEECKSDNVWIVAPASLLNQWKEEIVKWIDKDESNIQIYNETKIKREKLYKNIKKWNIISYETLRNDYSKNVNLKRNIINSFMIFDEATKLKNKKTLTYKTFKLICVKVKFKLFMTGTPVNNALSDIDNVIKLIDKTITGNINDYIVWGQETFGYGWNARIINVIEGYKNIDQYIEKIKAAYIRNTKEEVAPQLPKKNIITIPIEQTNGHLKLKIQILEVLTAFTGFTLLQLLDTGIENLQTSESENIELLEFPKTFTNPKIETLKNLISEINNQVLIFSKFKQSCYNIIEKLEKEFPHLKIAVVTAETKNKNDIATKFRNKEIDIVIATETWAKGISFSDINYLINYDISASFEMYFQKQDRIHRINSTSPKFIYNLVGNVVESHIVSLLQEKIKLAEQITEGKGGFISEVNVKKEIIKKLGWKS